MINPAKLHRRAQESWTNSSPVPGSLGHRTPHQSGWFLAGQRALGCWILAGCCGITCANWPLAAFGQDPFGVSDSQEPDTASSPDPFGTGGTSGNRTNNAAAPVAAAPVSADDPDPLVRILRSNPPKTPADMAEAIQWMTRINRWDEVGRYVDTVQKSGWSTDQLSEFSLAGGSDLWFKLRDTTTELTDAQRNYVRDIAALPAKLARDPKWIDGWINRLAMPEAVDRREAQLRLTRAGREAVQRLSGYLMVGHAKVPGNILVDTLVQFDTVGIEALRAACTSPDQSVRDKVLVSIAKSSATEFSGELGGALYSQLLSAQARQLLTDTLMKKHGKVPEADAVRSYINAQFRIHLDEYQLLRSRPARVPGLVWTLGVDGKSVRVLEAPIPDHALESLNQVAIQRANLIGATRNDQVDCAAVMAQHAYQTNRPLVQEFSEATDLAFWKQVLDRSRLWQMHAAATVAVEHIGRDLASRPSTDPAFDYLAECLRSPLPKLRFQAVEAIARANVQSAYNGSAATLETAIEMSRLGQGPMVLVLGLSSDLRQAAQQQLSTLGCAAISVSSTADALQILDQPYPIELIMVVDRLPRNSVLTSVDRLRHSKRGGNLPVAVLTDDLDPLEVKELSTTPGVVMSVLSENTEQMPRVVAEMNRRLDTRPLTPTERATYAAVASQFLTTIAADGKQYGFYSLARWEKELASVSDNLASETYLSLLGGMGTVSSQQQLAELAANKAAAKDSRLLAADSFATSIGTHGLLLNDRSIVKLYERYNEQGPNDSVTVVALGKVLDAIESRTGKSKP